MSGTQVPAVKHLGQSSKNAPDTTWIQTLSGPLTVDAIWRHWKHDVHIYIYILSATVSGLEQAAPDGVRNVGTFINVSLADFKLSFWDLFQIIIIFFLFLFFLQESLPCSKNVLVCYVFSCL